LKEKLQTMNIRFSMNSSEENQRSSLSLLRHLLDRFEKTVGFNRFKTIELELFEKHDEEIKSSKMAVIKISSDKEVFIDQSLSKTWHDAMLNAFDFVVLQIESVVVKPEIKLA